MKQKFQADIAWHPDIFEQAVFSDLNSVLNLSHFSRMPDCERLSKGLFCETQRNQALSDYRFIAQTDEFDWQGLSYESLIFEHNTIPTRIDNWHDLFNACIWHLFPESKQVLNRLHVSDINQFGAKKRTKQRDALTLFDECGVVLAYQDEAQKQALQNHNWLQAFWHNRADWFESIRPFVFGHAMYEMSLKPFIGLTAKAYFVKVDEDFFKLSLAEQYAYLDGQLAKEFADDLKLSDNRYLSPLPILGIPGWAQENGKIEYYQNTDYFRPKRIQTKIRA